MSAGSTPTLDYIGNHTSSVTNPMLNGFTSALDRLRHVVTTLARSAAAVGYGLRQEVPFERWFFNQGFHRPIDNQTQLMNARAWALLAAIEGAIKVVAEGTAFVYARILSPPDANRHLEVLNAQWQGLTLSLLAIVSPNDAKAKAHNGGNPIIGSNPLNWRWGTLYTGKLDIPLWHVECRQYPWAESGSH